jgi:hypothetical protein
MLKGQLYKIILLVNFLLLFLAYYGGPLYGQAVYSKIRQIGETDFTSRAPSLKNRSS